MKKIFALLMALLFLLTGCQIEDILGGPPATEPPVSDQILRVHYLDVGQADCIFIEYGDFTMLIDGGNKADGSMVVSYLEQQGVQELDAVVCTHAHEDHVGGLPSVLAVYPAKAVYAPTRTHSSNIFDDFVYYVDQQGLQITIPSPGDTIEAEGLEITVLGPVESYSDPNNTSIVIMLEHGDNRFLLTGDMEQEAESDMLDYWGDSFDWSADVLKAGHHGSDTSTGYRFLNAVMPAHTVISVGEGNSYGHPGETTLSRLEDAESIVYRTDLLGTVIAASDGKTVTMTWGNQAAHPETPESGAVETTYIGNKNSKKFHLPTCSNLPAEKNQVLFDTYEEAIGEGYEPCSNCLG